MASNKSKTKKALIITGFLFLTASAIYYYEKGRSTRSALHFNDKAIIINDDGLIFQAKTSANTVADLLRETNLQLAGHDAIFPKRDALIYPGMRISIERAVKIQIQADGREIDNFSTAKTIGGALDENDITLSRLDKVSPDIFSSPRPDAPIIVTRINEEEVTKTEDIDFKTVYKTDSTLGWQETRTDQAGQKGQQVVRYKISYKNGKEVSRTVLEKTVTQEPVQAIVTKGTFMELGKAAKGQGTWYSYMGGMFAASTSLPKGSYAKVTNLANGKSIVVQINDYGPQGKGRIIDLDKVAFAKIASLGAGIIGVKVEPILN